MHPDLVVTAYRHQERELEQRLERRRAALERPATGSRPAARTGGGPGLAALRSAVRHVSAAAHRGRQAIADAGAPTQCCSPA
jgi:hypothetical protein